MHWMVLPLKRYAEFSGRSRRKEYWLYTLFIFLVGVTISVIEGLLGLSGTIAGAYGPISAGVALGTLIPGIAVAVRRLHDIDRSGWWMLLEVPIYALLGLIVFLDAAGITIQSAGLALGGSLVVLVVGVILLIFFVTDGTAGPNRFGPDPKVPYEVDVFT